MPTATKSRYDAKKALSDYYVYVPIGAGQLLVEKTREMSKKAWSRARKQRKQLMKAYEDLGKRGEKLVTSIRRSAYTRRAVDQAKTARSQVRTAVNGIRKTADATATATKAAARKAG